MTKCSKLNKIAFNGSYFSYTFQLEENMKRNIIFAIFAIAIGLLSVSFTVAYQYFYPDRLPDGSPFHSGTGCRRED